MAALRCIWHPQIMPDLSSPETRVKPYENRPRRLTETPFLPIPKLGEPLLILPSDHLLLNEQSPHWLNNPQGVLTNLPIGS